MLTKRMKAAFSRQIRCVRFLRRSEQPQTNWLVINLDLGKPLTVFGSHAKKTAFVVFSQAILSVFGVCRLAQIVNSVVSPVAVNVVKLICRPTAVNIHPCQPMSGVQDVIQADANVPIFHFASRRAPGTAPPPRFVPSKYPRIGRVADQFVKSGLRDILRFHVLDYINEAAVKQA